MVLCLSQDLCKLNEILELDFVLCHTVLCNHWSCYIKTRHERQ